MIMIMQDYSRLIQMGIPLLLLLLHLNVYTAQQESYFSSIQLAKPGCQDRCGGVEIPYPFGISLDCSHNPWFEITCNHSFYSHDSHHHHHHPIPILTKLNIPVLGIRFTQQRLRVTITPRSFCLGDDIYSDHQVEVVPNKIIKKSSPFSYSSSENMFVMRGCPGTLFLYNEHHVPLAACATVCPANITFANGTTQSAGCNGFGCCQTPLPKLQRPLKTYYVSNETAINSCYSSTIMESTSVDEFQQNKSWLGAYPSILRYSAMGKDWKFSPYANCSATGEGCECQYRYEGNPYLQNGCQVAQACQGCKGHCFRTDDYTYYCESKSTPFIKHKATIIGPCVGFGSILLIFFCLWLRCMTKSWRQIRQRTKYFHSLLNQHMVTHASVGDVLERTKLFTTKELKRATDNFNEDRILGLGGQGTVYKGMLANGKIIAVKKPRVVDESHISEFINEVVILSLLNHRHIVRLFGCCLDNQSPLLVYEYISNGTLYDHLHGNEDSQLTWKMRLQIAAESAAAVAYLHSSSLNSIYHRDIKSSNILLDEKFRSKVSDFGISRTVNIDQTHLTTCVHGTLGYLDPGYFETHQFTDKSDVYSFGVVLVELLTGRKPVSMLNTVEGRHLAAYFLLSMRNYRLFDIIDPRVVHEATKEEVLVLANLARQCLNLSGNQRPTMKEVATILEALRVSEPSTLSQEMIYKNLKDENDHLISQSTTGAELKTFFTTPIEGYTSVIDNLPPPHDTV